MEEELPRASAAQDRRLDHRGDRPIGASEPIASVLDGRAQQGFVVRRRCKAEIELGLYERHRVCVLGELHCLQLRDRVREGQVRQVERDDLDGVGNRLDVQLGEVDPLEVDDARLLAKRPEQLPVPGVDRVHAPRPCLQQHAGEAACRGPGVECDSAGHGDGEGVECGLELRLATKGLSSSERDRGACTYERGSVRHDSAVDDDRPSGDRRVGIIDGWVCARQLVAEPAQLHTAFPGHGGLLSSLGLLAKRRSGGARARSGRPVDVRSYT